MIFEKWDHGTIVTIGVMLGGIVTTILTGRQKKDVMKFDEAQSIRAELRTDITQMQAKMEQIGKDLDLWKEKYYGLAEENLKILTRCKALELEVSELKKRVSHTGSGVLLPQSVSKPQTQSHRGSRPAKENPSALD